MEPERQIVLTHKKTVREKCPYLTDTCPNEFLVDWCVNYEKRDCPRFPDFKPGNHITVHPI